MIDINKTYKTRDGREVRIYATDGDGTHPIHGAIKNETWEVSDWTQNGKVSYRDTDDWDDDIFEVKSKRTIEFWVIVDEDGYLSLWDNKREAHDYKMHNRIACLRFTHEFEEGEGL